MQSGLQIVYLELVREVNLLIGIRLKAVNIPVLLITGEIDTKFVNIAREMVKYLPFVSHRDNKRCRTCNTCGKTDFICYNDRGAYYTVNKIEEGKL